MWGGLGAYITISKRFPRRSSLKRRGRALNVRGRRTRNVASPMKSIRVGTRRKTSGLAKWQQTPPSQEERL